MKNILIPIVLLFVLFSCGEHSVTVNIETDTKSDEPKEQLYYFGDSITTDGAEDVANLPKLLENEDTVKVKLSGVIDEVCQVKGCWITMNVGEDEMRIRFKDYGFFIPKDASGKNVIIEGVAYRDTTTVEDLRHYAEDAGETEETINAITDPEISLSFEATGVIIKDEE